jgi:hypothetical protein
MKLHGRTEACDNCCNVLFPASLPLLLLLLLFPAGLLKRYGLDISSSDILQATLDGDDLPVCVVAESAELNR